MKTWFYFDFNYFVSSSSTSYSPPCSPVLSLSWSPHYLLFPSTLLPSSFWSSDFFSSCLSSALYSQSLSLILHSVFAVSFVMFLFLRVIIPPISPLVSCYYSLSLTYAKKIWMFISVYCRSFLLPE
jgi:hypothetical protein